MRVRPGNRGAWRVEDESGARGSCPTFAEAEQLAEQLLRDLGGGQILVYDATCGCAPSSACHRKSADPLAPPTRGRSSARGADESGGARES